jgi:uncharacterized surface protein with fasciclin (FAS1) repeats
MSTNSNMGNTPAANAGTAAKNIVDTAAANGSFRTFSKALRQAGMSDTLRGAGPFTVFAPTDEAFAKLPPGKLEELMKSENKDELVSILNYHVLAGRSSAAEMGKLKEAKTLGGSAPIALEGSKLSIDGATLTTPDIASSNGWLHGIDKVNMPVKH